MQPAARFGRRAPVQPSWPATPPPPEAESRPRDPEPEAPVAKVAEPIQRGLPVLTVGLLALLSLVFFQEINFALSPAPNLSPGFATRIALGGVGRNLVLGHGDWWRLFTAPLLHASPEHLIGNGLVLLFTGYYLERLIGRAWFGAAFVIGGLGGAVCSMLLNPADLNSVGASGAIMGLLGTAFVCSFHVEAFEGRAKAQRRIAFQAIPALLPLGGNGAATTVTDYGAHAGGAMAGVALGLFLLAIWPENQARPPWRRVGMGIAMAGALAALASVGFIVAQYPVHVANTVGMIPDAEVPQKVTDQAARSAALVLAYPKDPRGHLFRAIAYGQAEDADGMVRELETGLADPTVFNQDLPAQYQPMMRLMLASVLVAKGRPRDARDWIGNACAYPFANPKIDKVLADLKTAGVCPA